MQTSRIPEFYKLSVADRVRLVREKGMLSKDDYLALTTGEHTLKVHHADRMIENVIGVMGLPVGLGLKFATMFIGPWSVMLRLSPSFWLWLSFVP